MPVTAIHPLRDPARELQAAGAGVLMNQQAMRETPAASAAFTSSRASANHGGSAALSRDGHGRSPRQSSSAASAASQTWSSFCGGVDDAKSARIGACQLEITIAHAVEELRRLDFETIDGAAPRLHAFEADAHRHVEQDRAVGIQVAMHGLRESGR